METFFFIMMVGFICVVVAQTGKWAGKRHGRKREWTFEELSRLSAEVQEEQRRKAEEWRAITAESAAKAKAEDEAKRRKSDGEEKQSGR